MSQKRWLPGLGSQLANPRAQLSGQPSSTPPAPIFTLLSPEAAALSVDSMVDGKHFPFVSPCAHLSSFIPRELTLLTFSYLTSSSPHPSTTQMHCRCALTSLLPCSTRLCCDSIPASPIERLQHPQHICLSQILHFLLWCFPQLT